jgi:hypothetical protein
MQLDPNTWLHVTHVYVQLYRQLPRHYTLASRGTEVPLLRLAKPLNPLPDFAA